MTEQPQSFFHIGGFWAFAATILTIIAGLIKVTDYYRKRSQEKKLENSIALAKHDSEIAAAILAAQVATQQHEDVEGLMKGQQSTHEATERMETMLGRIHRDANAQTTALDAHVVDDNKRFVEIAHRFDAQDVILLEIPTIAARLQALIDASVKRTRPIPKGV